MEGIDMKTADDRTTDSEAPTVDLKAEHVEEEVKTDQTIDMSTTESETTSKAQDDQTTQTSKTTTASEDSEKEEKGKEAEQGWFSKFFGGKK